MIEEKQFDDLSKFATSSWAIWTDEFNKKGCKEGMPGQPKKYFYENRSILKNNIILLGLNPSGNSDNINPKADKEYWSMRNFHTIGHKGDLCLKETVKDKKLDNIWGAYMTDLSDEINTFADKVVITDGHIKKFNKKLSILGAENFYVISFKEDKVFSPIFNFFQSKGVKIKSNNCGKVIIKDKETEIFVKEFSVCLDKKYIVFYSVLHYSYVVNGFGNYRRPEFERQMEYINKVVSVPHFA